MSRRILLVTGEYPPDEGGVADYSRCLAEALVAQGQQVAVLTTRRPRHGAMDEGGDPGASRRRDDPPGVGAIPVHRLAAPGWPWRSLEQTAALARTWRADWLHLQYQAAAFRLGLPIHLLPGYLRWRLPDLRLAVTYHDLREPYLFPKAGRLRGRAVQGLAQRSHLALTTNAADRLALAATLAARGGAAPRQALVPIGSNLPDAPPPGYERQAFRAAQGLGPEVLLLGSFGFLNASKGGAQLLEALAALRAAGRDGRLVLIGGTAGASDASNAQALAAFRAQAQAMGLSPWLIWTGFLPPPQVSAWLRALDLALLPYTDGASFRRGSLLAALSHGCAVISTRAAGMTAPSSAVQAHDHASFPTADDALLPPLEDGVQALLCPPEDGASLVRAVLHLAAEPALAAALGREARRLAEAFGWPAIAERHRRLYDLEDA